MTQWNQEMFSFSLSLCNSDRKLYLSGSDPVFPKKTRLLSLPHVYTDVSDCRHVLDLVLDPTGSRTGQSHAGSHFSPHAPHPARQFAKVSTARLLPKGEFASPINRSWYWHQYFPSSIYGWYDIKLANFVTPLWTRFESNARRRCVCRDRRNPIGWPSRRKLGLIGISRLSEINWAVHQSAIIPV